MSPEINGVPDWYDDWRTSEPEYAEQPKCPICGNECDTFYTDRCGDVVGCDVCLIARDAWDFVED